MAFCVVKKRLLADKDKDKGTTDHRKDEGYGTRVVIVCSALVFVDSGKAAKTGYGVYLRKYWLREREPSEKLHVLLLFQHLATVVGKRTAQKPSHPCYAMSRVLTVGYCCKMCLLRYTSYVSEPTTLAL